MSPELLDQTARDASAPAHPLIVVDETRLCSICGRWCRAGEEARKWIGQTIVQPGCADGEFACRGGA